MYVECVKGVNIMYNGSKAMSKVLKVVFVAFMQHCIQSNGTHASHVRSWKCTLYTGQLTPIIGKATTFCFVGLAVHQSEEAALLTFWDLSNYKGDCRQDAQPIPNS